MRRRSWVRDAGLTATTLYRGGFFTATDPQIARAGAGHRIHIFQLADSTAPLPEGVLNGRGQIGAGAVDTRERKGYVEAASYTGSIEIELFNDGLWARDGREVLAETVQRFVERVTG